MAKKSKKQLESLTHNRASRKNIPTAEYQSVMEEEDHHSVQVAYERRNRDLDPQLIWRGKDIQNETELQVQAPPLFIQEKVHPKVLIDDLQRWSEETNKEEANVPPDLFADFNGLPSAEAYTEFYQHDANWSNRMILGDSLQVMASLAEREGLRGKVQCIYIDPPYGIKFNSNFQWSTTSRDVKDGNAGHITREPEQVKAFRDTWRDGIHSYLTYLRDRLTVARDLLAESGSVFVQIGDENVHRVRAVMDEVFGDENFVSEILLKKGGTATSKHLPTTSDFILFYAKRIESVKYQQLFSRKEIGVGESTGQRYDQLELSNGKRRPLTRDEKDNPNLLPPDGRLFKHSNPCSMDENKCHRENPLMVFGRQFTPPNARHWSTHPNLMNRVVQANRIIPTGKNLAYVMYIDDYPAVPINNIWTDVLMRSTKQYVIETASTVIQRCILMTTDPGDLVLDPTCGSGTTAYVAEQWGRRWITIDTSRVALALARARIMGARYPYYLLADSRDGQIKAAALARKAPSDASTYNDIRQGFVYKRVPHITLKSIANNTEIDDIHAKFQKTLEPLRTALNDALGTSWEEWEIPRETDDDWTENAKKTHADWWAQRIARQQEMDTAIAAKADYEYLYDKPYEDNKKVRVAGPFTVESLSPHRMLGVDENDNLMDYAEKPDFAEVILDHLKTAGVQQTSKTDRIDFISLVPWPGELIDAEGVYRDQSATERRAAVFIGPEFGTVSRPDLVSAAREAADAGFEVLIACAFNYDAHSAELAKLGRIPILKARINADLHMATDLKNTGKGNLFVIFGDPDIDILDSENEQIQVEIKGVDVFHPNTGEIRSDGPEGIACWFIDTNYNEESFFVRHAYFPRTTSDPYKALKNTLKCEINPEAWETLRSTISRPFDKPKSGRFAVKIINHLGDEVMKVYRYDRN